MSIKNFENISYSNEEIDINLPTTLVKSFSQKPDPVVVQLIYVSDETLMIIPEEHAKTKGLLRLTSDDGFDLSPGATFVFRIIWDSFIKPDDYTVLPLINIISGVKEMGNVPANENDLGPLNWNLVGPENAEEYDMSLVLLLSNTSQDTFRDWQFTEFLLQYELL